MGALHEDIEDGEYFSVLRGIARVKDPLHGRANRRHLIAGAQQRPRLGIELIAEAEGLPAAWLERLSVILTDGTSRIETRVEKLLRGRWGRDGLYRYALRTFPISDGSAGSTDIVIVTPMGRSFARPLHALLDARPVPRS